MENLEEVTKIIEKVQEGDENAFRHLYEMYYKRVYFMGYYYLSSHAMAEDITQETFIKVYQNINTLKSRNAFSSWLMKIVYRECMLVIRKKSRRKNIVNITSEDVEVYADEKKVNYLKEKNENESIRRIVSESLNSMSSKLKDVGYLRYFEELSIVEISNVLDIPIGTVKSRLNKINIALRTDLKKEKITPQSYQVYVSSLPILIAAGYSLVFENRVSKVIVSMENYNKIIENSSIITKTGLSLFGSLSAAKILAGITIVGGVLAGYTLLQPKENEVLNEVAILEPMIETVSFMEKASILTVEVFDQYTNQTLNVKVTTSNNEYDEIIMNGTNELVVYHNGIYNIQLIKDNQVIDESTIHINNLDFDEPNYLGVEIHENKYTLLFNDVHSGINPEAVYATKNGDDFYDFVFEPLSNVLRFENDVYSSYEFFILDYAGNEKKISVYPSLE